ncbi:YlbF family regulator [Bacillus sp. FJAT-49711]|uniref:YlbF family regulator n=1 Tax=Bacillus sp. FJAT-49711 TaxID=2833585 RepID=UPI001BCA25BB|nr:YlbF family regulator [Bacillus sp. FJAT-49711]MBS4219531.1 YlbF family regulator [Bacillus sp. FJAT-49711]
MDKQPVYEYMEELCAALLEQEAYTDLKDMINHFYEDENAIKQYEHFKEKQGYLYDKEQQGIELTEEEISDYNEEELELFNNDRIRQFLYAQREFNDLQSIINQYFQKTVELGTLPKRREIKKGGCGCGGSCGGH